MQRSHRAQGIASRALARARAIKGRGARAAPRARIQRGESAPVPSAAALAEARERARRAEEEGTEALRRTGSVARGGSPQRALASWWAVGVVVEAVGSPPSSGWRRAASAEGRGRAASADQETENRQNPRAVMCLQRSAEAFGSSCVAREIDESQRGVAGHPQFHAHVFVRMPFGP